MKKDIERELNALTMALNSAKADYNMFMLECLFSKKFSKNKQLLEIQTMYKTFIDEKINEIESLSKKHMEAENEE